MLKQVVGHVKVIVQFYAHVEARGIKSNQYQVRCLNLDTGATYTFSFYDATDKKEKHHEDLMKDVLSTIKLNSRYTEEAFPNFESFANECGYNVDNSKDKEVYLNFLKSGKSIRNVFTEELLETLPD
ncbi:hypothetical protein AB1283_12420 [Bacillus sp. S13(2024)]|uniref:hypothetical protein n=1 Tax=unclassified Bacillus (in: firmicutes) TaxID=185979 RepID=UPI003D1F6392